MAPSGAWAKDAHWEQCCPICFSPFERATRWPAGWLHFNCYWRTKELALWRNGQNLAGKMFFTLGASEQCGRRAGQHTCAIKTMTLESESEKRANEN